MYGMYGMYGMYPTGMMCGNMYNMAGMYAPGVNTHQQLKMKYHIEPHDYNRPYAQGLSMPIVPRSNEQNYRKELGIVRFLRRCFQ